MADLQHTALVSAEVHEPKHITGGGTAQSGQVITNSGSVAATSEYRSLISTEVSEFDYYLVVIEPDSSLTEDTFVVVPTAGILTEVQTVISDALVTGDNIYTFTVDGNATTPPTMTVTQSGSNSGDVDNVTISSGGELPVGGVIQIANNGGNSDAAVRTYFTLTIRRA